MGKEAKIGLSIIGILVFVFAVVLGQRMLGSKEESSVAKDDKKTFQSKKEEGKTPGDPKNPRFSLFDAKEKKGSPSTDSNSRGKATSALAVSQNASGTSQAADIWSLSNDKSAYNDKSTAPNPLMAKPTNSTTLQAQQGTGTAGAGGSPYSAGASSAYSTDRYSSAVSRAATPRPGVAVLGSPPSSYPSNSGYPSNATYPSNSNYPSNAGSAPAPGSTQAADGRYAASNAYRSPSAGVYGNPEPYERAAVGPRTGSARLDTSDAYGHRSTPLDSQPPSSRYGADPRSAGQSGSGYDSNSGYGTSSSYGSNSGYDNNSSYGSNSGYGGDSRYQSTSYGSSYSSGSDYGGGPQSDGTYIVKPHQNYWEISKDVYGTGAYFKALVEANRSRVPDENRLKVGDRIKTPDLAQLEQTYPELCPAPERRETMRKRAEMANSSPRYGGSERQYIVQSGDTLYDIARYELGDAARWTEIYELNRPLLQDSFDYLTPGLKLALPSKDGKPASSANTYDTSSNYGGNSSQQRNYPTDAPRTATRPGYDNTSNYGGYNSPNYGTSNAASQPLPHYQDSNYNTPYQQPSPASYPR